MKKRLLLVLIIVIVLYQLWPHHKPAIKTAAKAPASKITDGNVYWDYQYKPDSRTIAQWTDDCDPQQAYQPSSGIYSYWCRTPYNNSFDRDQAKPADWVWVR